MGVDKVARNNKIIIDLNAVFINDGQEQPERLTRLNQITIQQMRILVDDRTTRRLEGNE